MAYKVIMWGTGQIGITVLHKAANQRLYRGVRLDRRQRRHCLNSYITLRIVFEVLHQCLHGRPDFQLPEDIRSIQTDIRIGVSKQSVHHRHPSIIRPPCPAV